MVLDVIEPWIVLGSDVIEPMIVGSDVIGSDVKNLWLLVGSGVQVV